MKITPAPCPVCQSKDIGSMAALSRLGFGAKVSFYTFCWQCWENGPKCGTANEAIIAWNQNARELCKSHERN